MVFNVTKEKIRVRMSDVDGDVWPTPATREKDGPKMMQLLPLITGPSRQTVLTMPDVLGPVYDEVNKKYGTDYEPLTDSLTFKAANWVMGIKRSFTEWLDGLSTDASQPTK